ncbi:DUF6888 family protein [Nostoc sp.]|uniref:DUF6888 family protein n=1 Tax=Nostoc sp. TaxID=1180 RepID=UPI003FA5669A
MVKGIEPTIEQLKAFFDFCVRDSNLLRDIALVRFDQRTSRIVILIGETIQEEILSNGENIIR